MNAQDFRATALALPDTSEAPHFDRLAFRTPKRIFATLAADGLSANLRLEPEHQDLLVTAHPAAFQPVSGAWGRQGWTVVTLSSVDAKTLAHALSVAHGLAKPTPPRPRKKRP